MKQYKVTLFVLGLPMTSGNTRVEYIEAETQDEAEQMAHDWYASDGWGVYGSKEVRDELTDEQKKQAVRHASSLLSNIVPDSQERGEIMAEIEDDIISDIEDCAGWQELDEDEWCEGDVEIALARVIYDKICG
jgi:hypothetical protein